ncbi:MAG: RagB/SusD family nutrient uptake outer membrane protein [Flavobacterium sp.]|nr:RagB/SusD family nutrient uptake outer membrane protein [Flavobacterium sp.]
MNNKTFLSLVIMGFSVFISSCNKKLDVVPTQSLTPQVGIKTEGDLVGLLIGAYDNLGNSSSYGGDVQLMADLWANRQYQRFRGTFGGLLEIGSITTTSNTILVNNAWAASLWRNAYTSINTCNLVLENLNLSKNSIRPTNSVEGEALFIRGSMYFELARLYGKTWGDGNNASNLAVPLVLKSSPFDVSGLTGANYPARNTVEQVYNQAKADLQKAVTLLPISNLHYATKWAAMAQLSRIALMQGDYATARDMANNVINSNSFSLATNFKDLYYSYINFNGVAPKEYVFYMRNTTQDASNSLNNYYGQTVSSIPGTAGRGDMDIQTAWINLHEIGDDRGVFFLTTNRRLTQKHLDRFGHVPVIRLAEMYLTRAEANFRLGTTIGASPLTDINTIRTRTRLAALATVTLTNILKERDIELAFEGHFLHDIKRNRLNARGSNGTNGPAWNSPRLIMPIPQAEIDVNKNLVQNEGY